VHGISYSLTAIVVLDKSVFKEGTVKEKIILEFDLSKAKSYNKSINSCGQTGQQAVFSFGAGNIGEHPITGSFNFDEGGKVVDR
jgi:hypothetical protein